MIETVYNIRAYEAVDFRFVRSIFMQQIPFYKIILIDPKKLYKMIFFSANHFAFRDRSSAVIFW